MAKLFKSILLLGVICLLVWGGVIVYWQQARFSPSISDLAIFMVLLPLGLWLTVLFVLRLRARKNKPEDAPATSSHAAQSDVVPAAPVKRLEVFAAGVLTPMGDELDAIMAGVQADPIPPLDRELTDDNGFPLPSRRYAALNLDNLPEAWRASERSTSFDDAHLRALAMLAPLLEQFLPYLQTLNVIHSTSADPAQQSRVAVLNPAWNGEAVAAEEVTPASNRHIPKRVQLQLLVDAEFDAHACTVLRNGMLELLESLGLSLSWIELEVRPMRVERLTTHLSDVVEMLAQHPEPVLLLLLSSGSTVSQQMLDQWRRDGRMNPDGSHFAGEAAAGLLLGNAAVQMTGWQAMAQLGKTFSAPCDAEVKGRHRSSQVFSALMSRLVTDSGSLPAEFQWLCSGMGHGSELIETLPLFSSVPTPPDVYEILHLRGATGEASIGGRLAAYALACQQAAAQQQSVLLVLNDGSTERGLCRIDHADEEQEKEQALAT